MACAAGLHMATKKPTKTETSVKIDRTAKPTKTALAAALELFKPDYDDVLDTIERKFKLGQGTMSREARASSQISTGLLGTDILFGGGILPGAWYTMFGGEGSAKCLDPSSLVPTSKGLLTLEELYAQSSKTTTSGFSKTAPFSVDSHTGNARKVTHVAVAHGETRCIETCMGDQITGLNEHRLWVFSEDGFVFKRLDELGRLDWIPKRLPRMTWPTTAPAVSFTPTVARMNACLVGTNTEETCGFPTAVTKDLAFITGLLLSDGSKDQRFSNSDPELVSKIAFRSKKVFANSGVCTDLGWTPHPLVRDFFDEFIGLSSSQEKHVPTAIRMSTKVVQAEFLRAIFEGASTAAACKNIEFASHSKTLAYQIRSMLECFGVLCSFHESGSWALYGSSKLCRPLYRVVVHPEFLKTYATTIGFVSRHKKEALKQCVARHAKTDARQSNCVTQVLPGKAELLRATSGMRNTLARKLNDLRTSKVTNLTRTLYSDIREEMIDNRLDSLVERLDLCVDYYWTTIQYNARASKKSCLVMDLNVEQDHSYYVNGLISHNSTHLAHIKIAAADSGVPIMCDYDYEGCVTTDTMIQVAGLDIPFAELIADTPTPDVEGPIEKFVTIDTVGGETVLARLYYGGCKPITCIETSTGTELRGHNHPVLIKTDRGPVWRKIEDLKIGDVVYQRRHTQVSA